MKWLVCGGRDFANPPLNKPPYSLKSGGYCYVNKDSPLWPQKEKEIYFVYSELDKLAITYSTYYDPNDNWLPSDIHVISGAAKGVDSAAIEWAIINYCSYTEFPANWDKYGRSAGYKRNAQMLEEGKPDLVIAFPGGKGTAMMVKLAQEAGVEVIIVPGL